MPEVPPNRFGFQADTLVYPVVHIDSTLVFYRTIAIAQFDPSATGRNVRELLERFEGEIVAGTEVGGYVLRLPDLGPLVATFRQRLREMNEMPGVELVYPAAYHQRIIRHGGGRATPDNTGPPARAA